MKCNFTVKFFALRHLVLVGPLPRRGERPTVSHGAAERRIGQMAALSRMAHSLTHPAMQPRNATPAMSGRSGWEPTEGAAR
jgi:hypothetical protein